MKVIICSPLMSYPGHFLRTTKEKAVCMTRAGMEVTVLGFCESFRGEFAENNLAYVSVFSSLPDKWQKRTERYSRRFGVAWKIIVENFWTHLLALRYARANKSDVVFITDLEPWVICLLAVCGFIKSKNNIVAFFPYPYFEKSTAFSLPFFSFCRALLNHCLTPRMTSMIEIICDNQFTVARIFKRNSSRIHIVPEGFLYSGASRDEKQEARRQLGIPPNKKALLFFGVANQNKGAQLLYEALDGLEPDFVLLIVGTINSMFRPLKGGRQHKLSRWEDNIIRVPRFVSEDERKLYFMACDAVVLPYCKGFCVGSGGLQGAIVYGKAVIASDQYLLGHLIRTHGLGLLFPPEDAEKLRNCLREFAGKPEGWFAEVEKNCRQLASKYSWNNTGAIYRETFEKIIMNSIRKTDNA